MLMQVANARTRKQQPESTALHALLETINSNNRLVTQTLKRGFVHGRLLEQSTVQAVAYLDTVRVHLYRYALAQLRWQVLKHVFLQAPDQQVPLQNSIELCQIAAVAPIIHPPGNEHLLAATVALTVLIPCAQYPWR